jgi:hypothetical protein
VWNDITLPRRGVWHGRGPLCCWMAAGREGGPIQLESSVQVRICLPSHRPIVRVSSMVGQRLVGSRRKGRRKGVRRRGTHDELTTPHLACLARLGRSSCCIMLTDLLLLAVFPDGPRPCSRLLTRFASPLSRPLTLAPLARSSCVSFPLSFVLPNPDSSPLT